MLTNANKETTMTKMIETDYVVADGESQAVAVGKAILSALESRDTVDVERGDEMDDAQWSELRDYLGRRGVRLHGGVASHA